MGRLVGALLVLWLVVFTIVGASLMTAASQPAAPFNDEEKTR